ncbi:MAG: prepilin peptidase [Deltaproteobacteria bacterium]|nr:prepilin peptidase [Deltaproteobacteria bacterium]
MNVCIYRLPRNESLISPRSRCTHCGETIRFYDNLPLISYILLLGRCRRCRHMISWRYPAVEALTGLLSLFLFIRYGLSLQYFLFLLYLASLVTMGFIDLYHQIIPDVLSLPGIAAGWAAAWLIGHVSWLDSLIGMAAGGGSLFLVAFVYQRLTGREGMGGGDIKLFAMIGAWMGWWPLPFVALISALTGLVIGLAFILLSGKGFRARIPFGPFLSLGAILYFFFGPQLTQWYVGPYG